MIDTYSVIVEFLVSAESEDEAFKHIADGVGVSPLSSYPFRGFYVAPQDFLELELAIKTLGQLKVEKDLQSSKVTEG